MKTTNIQGMHSYLMETFGTFILVLIFGFTGDPLAIGLGLMALIYFGINISGAHYNPAVSFAFFLKRKLSALTFLGYVISQLTGAFIAAYVLYALSGSVFYIESPTSTDLYQQAFSETLLTTLFVLMMVLFSLSKSFTRSHLIGIVAGLTFTGMLMVGTPLSGGVLNPATFIGSAGFDLLLGGNSYLDLPLYTLAPLTGGALAAFIFTYFHGSMAE